MKKPIVSVIVNTKNEEKNLPQLAASLRRGSGLIYELIVVDNYSTDKTAAVAKKLGARFFQYGPERSIQKNYGARQAQGEYLLFMDADMTVVPGLMTECVQKSRQEQLGAIIVPLRSGGGNFWAQCRALEWRCYEGDDVIEAARFFRKSTFFQVGGNDEELVSFEDWDLQDRLRKMGIITGRTKKPLIHHEVAFNPIISMKKKFYYGKKGVNYLRKKVPFSWSRHTPWRWCYVRHWLLLLKDPLHAIGFIVQKHFEFAGGVAGMFWAIIDRRLKNEKK